MSIKGDLREWDVDIHALQHLTSVPPDDPNGALYIDGEPYPPEGGGAAYTHPNHSGDVVSVADGATTIQPGVVTNAMQASMVADRIKGRNGTDGAPEDLTAAEVVTMLAIDSDDITDTDKTHRFVTVAQIAEIAANTLKATNATHTGQVTGSGALTVDKTAITDQTEATPVGADHILIYDLSVTALRKALLSALPLTRPVATVADGATITIDASTAVNGIFKLVLGATGRTMAAPTGSPTDGQTIELWIIQDGTGSRTITTWNSAFKWAGVTSSPTLTTGANTVDIICFQYYSTSGVWMATTKILNATGT